MGTQKEREKTILIADDEQSICFFLQRCLQKAGYQVLLSSDGAEALKLLDQRQETIDLAITDLQMPRMGGDELIAKMRERGISIPVIMITADKSALGQLEKMTPYAFLFKPFSPKTITSLVCQALS